MSSPRRPIAVLALLLAPACTPHGPEASESQRASTHIEPPAPPTPPTPIEVPVPVPSEPTAGSRCFAAAVDHLLPFPPFHGELGDVDGDGDLDAVVMGWSGDDLVTMANDGDGGFVELARPFGEADALDFTLVDVDRDGRLDLVSAHPRAGEVHVRRGDGHGDFGRADVIALGRQVFEVSSEDFDADGAIDLLVTQLRHVAVLRGDGRGGFHAQPRVKVGQAPSYAFVADVDRNGRRELVLASNDDGGIDVVPFTGVELGRVRHTACGEGPIAIGMGDFDGDERPDLVTANMHSNDVCVFGGTARGFVERQRIDQSFDTLAVLDFDSDGIDDVAFAKGLRVDLWAGQKDGLFDSDTLEAGHGPRLAWARDLDRDGHGDLVLLNGERIQMTYDEAGRRIPLRPLDASLTVVLGHACEHVEPCMR
jgi:hypothetical protein